MEEALGQPPGGCPWAGRAEVQCLKEPSRKLAIMDIRRRSFDKITRPASSLRAYRNCRSLSTSMEFLTPELCLPKVDTPVGLAGSRQRDSLEDCYPEENKGDDRGESSVKEVRANQQTSVASTASFIQKCVLNPTNSSNLADSEETDVDPQIQAALKKMHKLDTILAKKQFKERAVKKQGKEMRAKICEELQSIGTTGSHEEVENTKLFLALISSGQDTTDCPSELETNEFLNQAEKTHSKSRNNPDFIKRNIELAKDSGSQIALLEEERQRLTELLKDTEDGIELQGLEEDVSGLLAPGEGYTPEPIEFHHLNEINIKLQVLLSNGGDFSAISNSCSKSPSQIYQEALAYANRSLEAVPGEKVLRDNKEQCDQQNRLKEIDHQLKCLEENFTEEKMGLSEEQLKTLLEECMQSQRTMSNVTMPKSQESLSCELSPPCYTRQDSTFHSASTLSKMLFEDHIVGMLMAQEKARLEDKSLCVNAKSEIPGYYISKAMADSHLSKDSLAQTEEHDDLEGLLKMGDKSVTEGHFMSRALNTKRLKKRSFLDEPLYCISTNNEPSTEADILSIPLQTKGGETLNNPLE
ncbi:fibrous sheath-interacting protein 1 isoform X2 [Cuculus canorus]|uniref:fibrous sheath-interacting protein 1 isoform X2 n=1 Tax=Cuculus canorus TaxID=55661 RepID=UPI0023AAF44E|nr:fibrous sheath-interacting protein 1 isoform X2 [Cuculus canorus]